MRYYKNTEAKAASSFGFSGMNEIKTLRTAANLTQKAFAECLGIPQRTIEDWEGGRRPPKEYLVRLIEYYLKSENII